MKHLFSLFLGMAIFTSISVIAQDIDIPKKLPSTAKETQKTESDFVAIAKWLENTTVDTTIPKRRMANAWTLAWVTNSPKVTIEIGSMVVNSFDKNANLMFVFIAGYTRYCLENNYSTDKLKANVAGMKSVIDCYKLGGQVIATDPINAIINADKDGKLEEWVMNAMKEK